MNVSPVTTWLRLTARTFRCVSVFALAGAVCGAADQPTSIEKTEVPIISMDEAVQKELLKLNQVLDANPKLEEQLRANVDRLTDSVVRAQHPELDALLKRQPDLPKALKSEQHFFVHRQIARLGRAKVTRKDAVELDKFLTQHTDISKALRKNPGQIVSPEFLIAHPPLAKFLESHPALSSVLLKRNDGSKKDKAAAPKK